MVDPILEARLDALEGNLLSVGPSDTVRDRLKEADVDDEVWAGLDATLGTGARAQLVEIKKIRGLLEKVQTDTPDDSPERRERIGKAWRRYGEVYQKSQDIFSEFLEFVGGLAFRERGLDERICRVADALIRACSNETIGDRWQSVTVPSPQEAVTKGLARIIRLRFPERNVWTLPLAAHEFGHVVMEVNDGLVRFVHEQVQPPGAAAGLLRSNAPESLATKSAELHLTELLADAFATYYMGPAYAWASIHLRLNPLTQDDEQHPSDAKRANVILALLDRLNQQAAGGDAPYATIIANLRERWTQMQEQAGATARLTGEDRRVLDELVEAVWDEFQVYLLAVSPYPDIGEHGWLVAKGWAGGWRQEIQGHNPPTVPRDVTRTSKLRDALNAAWLFRIHNPNHQDAVTAEALKLCEEIMNRQKESVVVTIADRTR